MSNEVVIQEFPAAGKYRVRIIRDVEKNGPPLLDIREYIASSAKTSFEGFTRRGVRLDLAAMKSLRGSLDAAIQGLEKK